ncbi:MAG: GGDEF domain-containing protein [Thermoanaerobaculia bacterium]|nr:GGDEF domain-containing protein [Thermoanaerobaculia bacterium]
MEIGVCTHREDLLGTLAGQCPGHSFKKCGDRADTAVLIVDHASGQVPCAGEVLFTVHLSDVEPRGSGANEVWVTEHEMLEHPLAVLGAAELVVGLRRQVAELAQAAAADAEIRSLLAEPDLETFSRRVSESMSRHLPVTAGSLFFYDPIREAFYLAYSAEETPPSDDELTRELLVRLHDEVGRPHPHVRLESADLEVRIALPMLSREDLIGVFIGRLVPGAQVTDPALDAATEYLGAIMPLIVNARQFSQSRELAMRDDLTKAYNRRFFESYLDEEIERTRRYGSVFSIIFLDLDDLKNINSSHGHLTGSRVLQEVAKRILSAVRTIDKVVRFGGDEFCIILPETDKDQAMSVAMRARNSMSSTTLEIDDTLEVRITASFGIATYPNHALSKDGLIRQADEAMYRVKSTTKNAIGVAGDFQPSRTGTGE